MGAHLRAGTDSSQPLAGARNCISTPHTAFFSEESYTELRSLAAATAAAALLGDPLPNVVNSRWLDMSAMEKRAKLSVREA